MDQSNQLWPVTSGPNPCANLFSQSHLDASSVTTLVMELVLLLMFMQHFPCLHVLNSSLMDFGESSVACCFHTEQLQAADASWLSQPSSQEMADLPFQINESGNRELFTQH